MLCRRRRKSAQTVDADTVHKPLRHALQPSQHSAVAAAAHGRPAVLCRRTRGLRQPVAQHVAPFAILKRRQGQGFAKNQRRLCGGCGMFAIGTTSDCDLRHRLRIFHRRRRNRRQLPQDAGVNVQPTDALRQRDCRRMDSVNRRHPQIQSPHRHHVHRKSGAPPCRRRPWQPIEQIHAAACRRQHHGATPRRVPLLSIV